MFRILALVIAAASAGCAAEPDPPPGQPQHVLLNELEPPPLNRPTAPSSVRADEPPPQAAPGDTPGVFAFREGRLIVGTIEVAGNVSVEPAVIRVQPESGAPIELRYRLPAGLSVPAPRSGAGRAAITQQTSPAATDRRVLVSIGEQPVLAEIWQQRSQPLEFEIGPGIRLVQGEAVSGNGQYAEAPVTVVDGGRTLVRVPIGEPVVVQSSAGPVRVLVQVTHLFTPSPADAGQVEGGYILRAWAVAAANQ